MNRSSAITLIRSRSIGIAVANAAATWVILIIAPLGLFTVITCTVLIFGISLAGGIVSDRVMLSILRRNGWEMLMSDDPELYTQARVQPPTQSPISQRDQNFLDK
ncbi:CRISPR-associated protein Csx18 [Limnospira platensis CENA597]|uniref:CRISPR-associated protein Csx18 n=1 Tax=Limnospira platensis TaxID=118562 RepID=UPI003DA1941A